MCFIQVPSNVWCAFLFCANPVTFVTTFTLFNLVTISIVCVAQCKRVCHILFCNSTVYPPPAHLSYPQMLSHNKSSVAYPSVRAI
jgi:hypothetical protein